MRPRARRGSQGKVLLSGFPAQSDKNVSRETLWSDWGRKSYKASDSGSFSDLVRSAKVSWQLQESGSGAAMARSVAEGYRGCKIIRNRR
jgi:hypothetical protein